MEATGPVDTLRTVRRTLLACLITGSALAAGPAHAADPDLWATINVCDTEAAPNSMGVRASMPGNGSKQKMYMRFHATYYSRARQAWYPVEGDGRSDWVLVGTAKVRARQGGYTFEFSQPAEGDTFVVRGVVEFQWRKRKRVVRKERATTRHGIENVGVGDPPGTSEGVCVIS
jgi:hypothetical protein